MNKTTVLFFIRSRRWLLLLAAPVIFTGCQKYEDKPLTPVLVDKALTTPSWQELRVEAQKTSSVQFPPTTLSPADGITPDTAAVLALLLNPSLRSMRDQHGEASAQLLQAGVLTNPQLTSSFAFVTGGYRTNTFNPYGIGVNWDVRQLIDRQARINSASYQLKQVDLEVAWQEWQTAQAARLAVYALAAAQIQLDQALYAQQILNKNYAIALKADALRLITLDDLSAALAASQQADALVLTSRQQLQQSRLDLARAIGLPPNTVFTLNPAALLPTSAVIPDAADLQNNVENRRLDLMALHMGYQSQQEQLRVDILRQFPNVNIGFDQESDDTNVHTTGFGVNIDLPIFDQNQGQIALNAATRQALYDDFIARVFGARADIASAIMDIGSLEAQIAQARLAADKYAALAGLERRGLSAQSVDIGAYAF